MVTLFVMLICLVAFIEALLRPARAYEAADKQKKVFWGIILGLAALAPWAFGAMHFITVLGVAAAIIYLVDVRPALRSNGGSFGKLEKIAMPLIVVGALAVVVLLWVLQFSW